MRFSNKFFACVCIVAGAAVAQGMAAQNSPAPASKPQTPPPARDAQTRITIEVTGGENSVPVENASVYVKFIEEHSLKKDKKLEMNVKTSRGHRPRSERANGESSGSSYRRRMEDVWTLARHH